MKVAVFSTHPHDATTLNIANAAKEHELTFFEPHLTGKTAPLAEGNSAVCIFVNDTADEAVLRMLRDRGVQLVTLRCTGFNNVDLVAAEALGVTVARVPVYSPYAVAEHALALILTLNRQTHRAYNRVRESNFLLDGLLGFDVHGRTVGVIGTGAIGGVFARIMIGLGCKVLAYDVAVRSECKRIGVEYVELPTLIQQSDIISLHCPLTPATKHMIGAGAIGRMKRGVMLINTSRGALIDTRAVIDGLKSGKIGYLGIDVYEEEGDLFFEDLSGRVLQDDVFARLTTFPNVLITGHQAFFTAEALKNIADTTIASLTEFAATGTCKNAISAQKYSARA